MFPQQKFFKSLFQSPQQWNQVCFQALQFQCLSQIPQFSSHMNVQLRYRSRNARNSKDKKQPLLPDDNTRVYEYQAKIRPRVRHTPQRDVIFLQDTAVAFRGEIMRNAPKRMIQKYVRHQNKKLPVKAAFITEDNKMEWAEKFADLNQSELLNKRMLKNFKTTLENVIVTFKRQIPTRLKTPQFIVPITKEDICNRVWNLKRIILDPENLQISTGAYDVIKHPGYWKCYYRCPDGEKVKLRVYCPTGGRRSSVAGNSWEGFPFRT